MSTAEKAEPLSPQNPWPGLRAFEESESEFFVGRTQEIAALFGLIGHSDVVVLGGKSGVGKSSLVRAGLFPRLKSADYLPFHVRLTVEAAADPRPLAAQILGHLTVAMDAANIVAPRPGSDESLWSYFHRRDLELWGPRNRLITPVIVLDQFEEVVRAAGESVASARRVSEFAAELEALLEHRPSEAMRQALEKDPKLALAYDFRRQGLKLVISLRKEYLADLDAWAVRVPALLANRFLLQRMNGIQALEVVQVPGKEIVNAETAHKIVDSVSISERERRLGLTPMPLEMREVEPALLSVVCAQLNRRRRQRDPVPSHITAELLSVEREDIIQHLYEDAFLDLAPSTRKWVEKSLLSASGHRLRGAREDSLSDKVPDRDIGILIDRHILQDDVVANVSWLELTHDLLTDPAMRSRTHGAAEEARLRAEAETAAARKKMWQARIVAACAVVVGLLVLFLWHKESEESRVAGEALKAATTLIGLQQTLGDQIVDNLHQQTQMTGQSQLELLQNITREALDFYGKSPPAADDEPAELSYADALMQDGFVRLASAKNGAVAVDDFKHALSIHQALLSQGSGNPALLRDIALDYQAVGDANQVAGGQNPLIEARDSYLLALQQLTATNPPSGDAQASADEAATYDRLGDVEQSLADIATASGYYQHALAIRNALIAGQKQANNNWLHDRALDIGHLGAIEQDKGALDKAISYYLKELPILTQVASSNTANGQWQYDLIGCQGALGGLYETTGDLKSANRYYTEAQNLRQQLVDRDPDNGNWRLKLAVGDNHFGSIAADQGNYQDAVSRYTLALGEMKRIAGKGGQANYLLEFDLATTLNSLGDAWEGQAEAASPTPEAIGFFKQAIDSYSQAKDLLADLHSHNSNSTNKTWANAQALNDDGFGKVYQFQAENPASSDQPAQLLGQAEPKFKQCIQIERDLIQGEPDNLAWRDEYAENLDHYGTVVEDEGRQLADQPTQKTAAWNDYEEARRDYFQPALEQRAKLTQACPSNVLWLHALAQLHDHLGDIADAESEIETEGARRLQDLQVARDQHLQCIAIDAKLIEQKSSRLEWERDLAEGGYYHLGNILLELGQVGDAQKQFQAADDLVAQLLQIQPTPELKALQDEVRKKLAPPPVAAHPS